MERQTSTDLDLRADPEPQSDNGPIIGIVVGLSVALVALGLAVFLMIRHKRKRAREEAPTTAVATEKPAQHNGEYGRCPPTRDGDYAPFPASDAAVYDAVPPQVYDAVAPATQEIAAAEM
jgi:hypothetical protein